MSERNTNLLSVDGSVYLYNSVFDKRKQAFFYKYLKEFIPWEETHIKLFGKKVKVPRLTAFYGDKGTRYTYSGNTHTALDWTPELLELKAKAEQIAQVSFNIVLLNYYRNGNDAMGWHADNEVELGPNPCIASLSFGVKRKFKLRNLSKKIKVDLELDSGSILIMKDECQHFWQHAIPKSSKINEPRINLTFRKVVRQSTSHFG